MSNQQAMINYLYQAHDKGAILTQIDAQPSKMAHYTANLSLKNAVALVENDSKMRLYPYNSPHSGLIILISNNVENSIPKLTVNNKIEHLQLIRTIGAKFFLDGEETTAKKAIKFVKRNSNVNVASTITPPIVQIRSI